MKYWVDYENNKNTFGNKNELEVTSKGSGYKVQIKNISDVVSNNSMDTLMVFAIKVGREKGLGKVKSIKAK